MLVYDICSYCNVSTTSSFPSTVTTKALKKQVFNIILYCLLITVCVSSVNNALLFKNGALHGETGNEIYDYRAACNSI